MRTITLTVLCVMLAIPGSSGFAAQPEKLVAITSVTQDGHLVLESGEHVTLLGVDLHRKPELGAKGVDWIRHFVSGNTASIDHDSLAVRPDAVYVYLKDGTLLNEEVIERGYAFASAYQFKLRDIFQKCQREAQQSKAGLWAQPDSATHMDAAAFLPGVWNGTRTVYHMVWHYRIDVPADGSGPARGISWYGMTEAQAESALQQGKLDTEELLNEGTHVCVLQHYKASASGDTINFESTGVERMVIGEAGGSEKQTSNHGSFTIRFRAVCPKSCLTPGWCEWRPSSKTQVIWPPGLPGVRLEPPARPGIYVVPAQSGKFEPSSIAGVVQLIQLYHLPPLIDSYKPDVFSGKLLPPGIVACDVAPPGTGGGTDDTSDERPGSRFTGRSLFRLWKDGALNKPLPLSLRKGATQKLACLEGGKYHYSCYLPTSYNHSRSAPVLINMSPGGKGKPLSTKMAEKLGWIMVGLTEASDGPWQPIVENRDAVLFDLRRRFNIDMKHIYFSGWSGGARASILAAAGYPENCAGIICVGARDSDFGNPPFNIPIFSITGDADYNNGEVTEDYSADLASGRLVKLAVFHGGHSWGPPEYHEQAIQWLADVAKPSDK